MSIVEFLENASTMKIYLIGSGLCLATVVTCMDSTGRECGDLGPPPSILDMPPPPMPSFLTAVLDDQPGSNESNSPNKDLLMETNELEPGKPCKAMCDTDQGVGFVELPQQGMTRVSHTLAPGPFLNLISCTGVVCVCLQKKKKKEFHFFLLSNTMRK